MELWITLSVLGLLFNSFVIVLFKYISLSANTILNSILHYNIFGGIISLLIVLFGNMRGSKEINFYTNRRILYLLGGMAVLRLMFAYFKFKGAVLAPNPAYSMVIIACSSILVMMCSLVLFKCHINYKTLLGVLVILFGIFIVIRYSRENSIF